MAAKTAFVTGSSGLIRSEMVAYLDERGSFTGRQHAGAELHGFLAYLADVYNHGGS